MGKMKRRMFLWYVLGSVGFGLFKKLLPGQEGEEEDVQPIIFKIFGQTVIIDWSEIIIGDPAGPNVRISGSGVEIRQASTVKGYWQTDGDFFLGSNVSAAASTYLAIFATAQTYNSESMGAGDFLLGNNSSNMGNIFYDASENQFKVRDGGDAVAFFDADDGLFAAGGINQSLQATEDWVQVNGVPLNMNPSSTPADPVANSAANLYVKDGQLIVQYKDGSTVKYWYMDLTIATDQRWTYTTTAP